MVYVSNGEVHYYVPSRLVPLLVLLAVLCVAILCLAVVLRARKDRRLRDSVMAGAPIPAGEFLDDWITAKSGRRAVGGYKLLDRPGCYVILTNPSGEGPGALKYEAVYVGQSTAVCSRVRAHLTGHGNGDVYADVRAGKDVVVRIVPCPANEMNEMEKALIAAFRATESYNVTHGGSRVR